MEDDDDDEMMILAAAALTSHGYHMDQIAEFATEWCEEGQHVHVLAIARDGSPIMLVIERPLDC
jgi:hypothetical protein